MKYTITFLSLLTIFSIPIQAQRTFSLSGGMRALRLIEKSYESSNGTYEIYDSRFFPGFEISSALAASLFESKRLSLELQITLSVSPLYLSERSIYSGDFTVGYTVANKISRKSINQLEAAPHFVIDLTHGRQIRRRNRKQVEWFLGGRTGVIGLINGTEEFEFQEFFPDNPDGTTNPLTEVYSDTRSISKWGSSLYIWMESGLRFRLHMTRRSIESLEFRGGLSVSNFNNNSSSADSYLIALAYVKRWKI